MKIQTVQMIRVQELDRVVMETYKRPYSFQQQKECQSCRIRSVTVPNKKAEDYKDYALDKTRDFRMGVSFKTWLDRDPDESFEDNKSEFILRLWWYRNFYPSLGMIVNDLHAKGILPAGDYIINIDW